MHYSSKHNILESCYLNVKKEEENVPSGFLKLRKNMDDAEVAEPVLPLLNLSNS